MLSAGGRRWLHKTCPGLSQPLAPNSALLLLLLLLLPATLHKFCTDGNEKLEQARGCDRTDEKKSIEVFIILVFLSVCTAEF